MLGLIHVIYQASLAMGSAVKHTSCLGSHYVQIIKRIKCDLQLYLGCPILLVEADLTSNSKWTPDMSTMSSVFTCFFGGTKHRRKRVNMSFPTKYGMAFLFMESDLTSDPIWLQPTMSNVQTWSVWVSITHSRKTVNLSHLNITHGGQAAILTLRSYQIPLTQWASQT